MLNLSSKRSALVEGVYTIIYKLWLPSVASQIAVCSALLRGADRSTRKYCRLSVSSNCKRVQLRAARPFGALDNLTDNAIPCGRNRVNSLRIIRRPCVRSISILGPRSVRGKSTRSNSSRSFDDALAPRPQPARPHSPASRTQTAHDHVRTFHSGSRPRERRATSQASRGLPR